MDHVANRAPSRCLHWFRQYLYLNLLEQAGGIRLAADNEWAGFTSLGCSGSKQSRTYDVQETYTFE
jgi:hypothetical protein